MIVKATNTIVHFPSMTHKNFRATDSTEVQFFKIFWIIVSAYHNANFTPHSECVFFFLSEFLFCLFDCIVDLFLGIFKVFRKKIFKVKPYHPIRIDGYNVSQVIKEVRQRLLCGPILANRIICLFFSFCYEAVNRV